MESRPATCQKPTSLPIRPSGPSVEPARYWDRIGGSLPHGRQRVVMHQHAGIAGEEAAVAGDVEVKERRDVSRLDLQRLATVPPSVRITSPAFGSRACAQPVPASQNRWITLNGKPSSSLSVYPQGSIGRIVVEPSRSGRSRRHRSPHPGRGPGRRAGFARSDGIPRWSGPASRLAKQVVRLRAALRKRIARRPRPSPAVLDTDSPGRSYHSCVQPVLPSVVDSGRPAACGTRQPTRLVETARAMAVELLDRRDVVQDFSSRLAAAALMFRLPPNRSSCSSVPLTPARIIELVSASMNRIRSSSTPRIHDRHAVDDHTSRCRETWGQVEGWRARRGCAAP